MNFLKKLGAITAFVGSLVATQAVSQSALDEILSDGVLKVGTTGDWNPMSVRDTATNSYVGYDIDIMTELAKDLGVELELVPTDWKTLVNGVVAGKYHMTGSASISPARLKAAGYSDSYISVEILPFTTEDKIGQFDSWESVDKSSVKVSTTLGTTLKSSCVSGFQTPQSMLSKRQHAAIRKSLQVAQMSSSLQILRALRS